MGEVFRDLFTPASGSKSSLVQLKPWKWCLISLLHNVGSYQTDTTSRVRRPESSSISLWEPQIC